MAILMTSLSACVNSLVLRFSVRTGEKGRNLHFWLLFDKKSQNEGM